MGRNAVSLDSLRTEMTTWKDVLAGERESPYFAALMTFIETERRSGKTIYPKNSEVFSSLSLTAFEDVRVVIVGQDPYPGPNQAHGLCFSVKHGIPLPPSLENIFKELGSSLDVPRPPHGCLEKWARQGVLLLNAVLTVEAGRPQSHSGLGWERFTDRVIQELNQRKDGLIFLLWGSHAQKKGAVIDPRRHHLLKSVHPSPLSAHRGFFGCGHFVKTNELLSAAGKSPIDWALD